MSWADYRREVFGEPYVVMHDGPDFSVLMERYRADGDIALGMLELGMAENDELAARSLELIVRNADVRQANTPPRVERTLRTALPDARGIFLVRLAQALFALTDDNGLGETIASVLTDSTVQSYERQAAASALATFEPTRRIVDALTSGIRDEEYLVRLNSAGSLSHMAGGVRNVWKDPELFELIGSPREGRDRRSVRRKWAQAAERLAAPFAGL